MTQLLRVEAIRAIEQTALAHLPTGTLMTRAAEAVAEQSVRLLRRLPPKTSVVALVGPGNNGGDALIATLMLRQRGFAARALALTPAAPQTPDAQWAWTQAAQAGLVPELMGDTFDTFGTQRVQSCLFIDGLFGIGLRRGLEGEALRWCQLLNRHEALVVAIDVPSGLNADVGCVLGGAAGSAIRATHTVTMIADKPGLHTGSALEYVGQVSVASLGLETTQPWPSEISAAHVGALLDADAVSDWIPRRSADSHKGRFGSVRVIGGAPGMQGAALLAARAAQSSGAGKVAIEGHEAGLHDLSQPQLMSALPGQSLTGVDSIVIGCGMGLSERARQRLRDVIDTDAALVMDADALNLVADDKFGCTSRATLKRQGPTVITPHPLEAARLLGTDARLVQSDRLTSAHALATRLNAVVVLKGAGSIISDPAGRWAISQAGDASLATAGTGDVLAGVIGGLMAQGLNAWQASCLGVWCHGRAGEHWRATQGPAAIGLSAGELPALIRGILNRHAGRLRQERLQGLPNGFQH